MILTSILIMTGNISLNRIGTSDDYDLISLYENYGNTGENDDNDSPFQFGNGNCAYYEANEFSDVSKDLMDPLSFFHLNCRGLSANWESFHSLLCDLHVNAFSFDIIGISEIYKTHNDPRINLEGYHELILKCRDGGPRGGVGMFVRDTMNYNIREDLSVFIPHICETLFIEIINDSGRNIVVGVIYRPNTELLADIDIYSSNMEHIMDTIQRENKQCMIMGDMNIDLLKFETHLRTNEYLDSIFANGFLPLISKPTRVTTSSATLIDHMYTNDIASSHHSGIIINDVADHFGTFCIFQGKLKKSKQSKIKKRSFKQSNVETFRRKLDAIDFTCIMNIDCPNIAYDTFLELYLNAFDESFPLKDVNVRSKYIKREPWFTSGLLKSSKTKSKLLSIKLRYPTDENIQKYKIYNNTFNKLKRKMKIFYYKSTLEEFKNDTKKCWTVLKQAIGKINDKSGYPLIFNINNTKISDQNKIAEGFNNFFSGIGLHTSHNVPHTNKCFSSYMPPSFHKTFFLGPVAPSDVSCVVKKMKTKIKFWT